MHFAGHGYFDDTNPTNSYMLLGEERANRITAKDLISLAPMRRRPVVVLSACSSAVVQPNGTNNFLGISGAFFRLGASAIIGARWPVSDLAAKEFSEAFHREFAAGASAASATALAQRAVSKSFRSDEAYAYICYSG